MKANKILAFLFAIAALIFGYRAVFVGPSEKAPAGNGPATAANPGPEVFVDHRAEAAALFQNVLDEFVQHPDLAAAQQGYEKVLALDPKFAPAHYDLAKIYEANMAWDKADAELKQVLQLAPHTKLSEEAVGEEKKVAGILAEWNTSDGPGKVRSRIYTAQAETYIHTHLYRDAAQYAQNAVKEDGANLKAYYLLATAQAYQANFDDALSTLKLAVPYVSSADNADYQNMVGLVKDQRDKVAGFQSANDALTQGRADTASDLFKQIGSETPTVKVKEIVADVLAGKPDDAAQIFDSVRANLDARLANNISQLIETANSDEQSAVTEGSKVSDSLNQQLTDLQQEQQNLERSVQDMINQAANDAAARQEARNASEAQARADMERQKELLDNSAGLYYGNVPVVALQRIRDFVSQGDRVTSISFGADGSFAVVTNQHLWRQGVPQGMEAALTSLMPNNQITHLMLAGTNWCVCYGTNGASWSIGRSDDLKTGYGRINKENSFLKDLCLSNDGFALVYGNTGYYEDDCPADMTAELKQLNQQGNQMGCVALSADNTNWVVTFNGCGYQAHGPQDFLNALDTVNKKGKAIYAVAFTPDDAGWVVITQP